MAAQLMDDGDMTSLLAFIDEFDVTPPPSSSFASSFSSSASSASPSRSLATADSFGSSSDPDAASGDELSSSPPPPDATVGAGTSSQKKKKKRSPASSSTALQRRKRAEIAALRELAVELEAQVADLKRLHPGDKLRVVSGAKRKPGATRSLWRELAVLQSRERQRAEMVNRKLKTILSNHQQVNDALRALVHKRSVLEVSKCGLNHCVMSVDITV